MTVQQKRYAAERIDSILAEKIQQLRERHTSDAVRLTNEEKDELVGIANEHIPIELGMRIKHTYGSRYEVDFGEQSAELDKETFNYQRDKLRTEATRLKDELFLGDAEQAIEMIKKFEKND